MSAGAWQLAVPLAAVAVLGGWIAVVDLREHRIPTPLVRALAVVAGAWGLWTGVAAGAWWAFGRGLLCALVAAGLFWLKWFLGGTGRGDLRLAPVLIGLAGWLGWTTAFLALFVPYLLALPWAVRRLARRRRRGVPHDVPESARAEAAPETSGATGRREAIPFAPALVAGWFVAVVLALV